MSAWKEAPFVRLLIPLISGLIFQWYLLLPARTGWLLLAIALAGLFVLSLQKLSQRFRRQWLTGIFINTLLFASGILLKASTDGKGPGSLYQSYSTDDTLLVRLEQTPEPGYRTLKAIACVTGQLRDNGRKGTPNGKMLIYFEKDDISTTLQYGDQLAIAKSLEKIKDINNPGGFNFQQYYAYRKIYFRVYLSQEDYIAMKVKKENYLKKFLLTFRKKITDILQKYIPGNRESAFAQAILTGYKEEIDEALFTAYANTGVVHLMAISGLHLGLIYALLAAFFYPFRNKKSIRLLKPVVIITGLWLFALFTGGSASVVRAALMFSFLLAGQLFQRKNNVYNSLAASAFCLLWYNPAWLWDAGFQLSYAAVLSILLFMKPLYHLLYIPYKVPDFFWKLAAVTLAAQVLTLPISIYYFHRFPLIFLIANLPVVPLTAIILSGAIVLCLASPLPILAKAVGWLLYQLIHAQNLFIEKLDSLPFASLDRLQLSLPQLVIVYALITALAFYWLQKNRQAFFVALVAAAAFCISKCWYLCIASRQQCLIVYNVPKFRAMDFISGRNYIFSGDDSVTCNKRIRSFYLEPARLLYRTQEVQQLPELQAHKNLFLFGNTTVLVLDYALPGKLPAQKIPVDIIILSHNPRMYLDDLVQVFACKKLVIDSSNPAWKAARWKKDAVRLHLPCHDVADKGAFVFHPY